MLHTLSSGSDSVDADSSGTGSAVATLVCTVVLEAFEGDGKTLARVEFSV